LTGVVEVELGFSAGPAVKCGAAFLTSTVVEAVSALASRGSKTAFKLSLWKVGMSLKSKLKNRPMETELMTKFMIINHGIDLFICFFIFWLMGIILS
jgi:hypothetical protein